MKEFGLALALAMAMAPAQGATLLVGGQGAFKMPSDAAAAAQDGDTVIITPGQYYDCAVWHSNDLTIESSGLGATLTDKACEGKAAFVIRGARTILRNLIFTRIRVPDGNGAGIRAEGGDLTIEGSQFIDNEIGLLAGDVVGSTIIIRDCSFVNNGHRDLLGAKADLSIGHVAELRIERSSIGNGKGGASITSYADRTILNAVDLKGAGTGSPYLIGIMSGSLIMDDISITIEGDQAPRLGAVVFAPINNDPTGTLSLRRVSLENHTQTSAVLLRDWSDLPAAMGDNRIAKGDTEMTKDGLIRYRLAEAAHRLIDWIHQIARNIRHIVGTMVAACRNYLHVVVDV